MTGVAPTVASVYTASHRLVRADPPSDWHLGRLFHGASLLDEQARAVARIAELAADAEVDVVVVAGDLYDRAIPPSDAVELFDDALLQLRRAGASVVAIAGNHDSAVRVGYGDRLLSEAGVSVRTARPHQRAVEIPATDGGPPLVVYPVPYLDPLRTAHLAEGDPVLEDATRGDAADGGAAVEGERRRFTHHDAMAWAMARVRAGLARRGPARSVVVAHTFLTGGNPSESERELTMGHVEQVRLDVFDGIDYVALGHLHQGQAFDGGRVAYSGSPLPYSFSEQHHTKAVRIVDFGPDGSVEVEVVPLGVGRPLRTLTGELRAARRPVPRGCRGRVGACPADRPAPPVAGDGTAAAPLPPRGGAAPRARRGRRHRTDPALRRADP